ncbi:MAG: hypothetical protein ACI9OJ_001440 [Myxococcota bacterium]
MVKGGKALGMYRLNLDLIRPDLPERLAYPLSRRGRPRSVDSFESIVGLGKEQRRAMTPCVNVEQCPCQPVRLMSKWLEVQERYRLFGFQGQHSEIALV